MAQLYGDQCSERYPPCRARGTPPTRRDSRAAKHGKTLKSSRSRRLKIAGQGYERWRLALILIPVRRQARIQHRFQLSDLSRRQPAFCAAPTPRNWRRPTGTGQSPPLLVRRHPRDPGTASLSPGHRSPASIKSRPPTAPAPASPRLAGSSPPPSRYLVPPGTARPTRLSRLSNPVIEDRLGRFTRPKLSLLYPQEILPIDQH